MPYRVITDPIVLPDRPADANKGTFGRVLILAGSTGMSGAAALSGLAALRGGAGLVTLAVPAAIQSIVATVEPSYMTVGLPCDERGQFSQGVQAHLPDLVRHPTAIACGPGWGQSDELFGLLEWLNGHVTQPLVIDADGLNLLSKNIELLASATGPRVLTPHPGEFARLTGLEIKHIQAHRVDVAVEFAVKHRVVVLLKGSATVITDGDRVAINDTGNSGMATGGCGDVLTGLITALLAAGLKAFEAARLGAYLHGLAGDLAAAEMSEPGLIASDLPRFLAKAWLQLKDLDLR